MPVERIHNKEDTWMFFRDENTGSRGYKTRYRKVYIQAPREEAIALFKERLRVDPEGFSCECCGQNHSIIENRAPEEYEWERDDVLIMIKDERLRYRY